MSLRISGLSKESIVDGPGFRYTVFAQGCPHNCYGCHNPETHPFDGGSLIEIDEIIKDIDKNPLLDGVTFSGGEPFCQVEELTRLGKIIHEKGLNVVTFTGYTFEQLISDKALMPLMLETDILIEGRFVLEERDLTLLFRGSKNQRILDCPASIKNNKAVELEL